jgi:hypothetical protein
MSQQIAQVRGVVCDSTGKNYVPNPTVRFVNNDTSFTLDFNNSQFKLMLTKYLSDTVYVKADGLGETKQYISLKHYEDKTFRFILPCGCKSIIDSDICPKCRSNKNVTKIVYGYPNDKLMKEADEGKIRLGGCMVGTCNHKYYCKKDNLEFGALGDFN